MPSPGVPLVGDLFDFAGSELAQYRAAERPSTTPSRRTGGPGIRRGPVIVTAVVCVVPVIGGIYLAARLLGWLAGGP